MLMRSLSLASFVTTYMVHPLLAKMEKASIV